MECPWNMWEIRVSGFYLLQLEGSNKFLLKEQTPVKVLQQSISIICMNIT